MQTILEIITTLLALMVGTLALLRFYSKKNNTFLLIGSGFIGNGLLDGYHLLLTSPFFNSYFPSVPSHLIPWSGIASRIFLSVLLLISWLAWKREVAIGPQGVVSEKLIFSAVASLTVISFLFITFVPLPRAYYPNSFFSSPEELFPALFFLLALIGYLQKGWWKDNSFEHWLVISLIIGFIGQAMFLSFSSQLFDLQFTIGHLLIMASYVCVLNGLILNNYHLFKKSEQQKTVLEKQILEHGQVLTAMREYRSQNELILNAAGEGILGFDLYGNHTFINPAASRMLGFEPQEVIGKPSHSLWHHSKPDGSPYPEEDCPIHKTKSNLFDNFSSDDVFWHKNGRAIAVNFTYTQIRQDDELLGAVVIFHDVGEIKAKENEIQKLSIVLEQSPVSIVITDTKGNIEYVNPFFTKTTGYSREEVYHRNPRVLKGETESDDFYINLWTTIKNGEIWNGEFLNKKKNGQLYYEQATISPIYNSSGQMTHFCAIKEDITQRKKNESALQAYSDALERSNNNLQDFAYIASHDLQEPLRKVLAFGDRLNSKFGPQLGEQGKDYLQRMNNAATRMRSLIDGLLSYSRISTLENDLVPVDLNLVVKSVLDDLEERISETEPQIEISELPTITADKLQMRQLFQNIISNAIKFQALEKKPQLNIRADIPADEKTDIAEKFFCIKIQDNGIGFDEKYIDKIFSPFQRLHGRSEYEGSGIGLAICKKITERHGGKIGVKSKPGSGSTFSLYFPKNKIME